MVSYWLHIKEAQVKSQDSLCEISGDKVKLGHVFPLSTHFSPATHDSTVVHMHHSNPWSQFKGNITEMSV
jgi:hypothetical protein